MKLARKVATISGIICILTYVGIFAYYGIFMNIGNYTVFHQCDDTTVTNVDLLFENYCKGCGDSLENADNLKVSTFTRFCRSCSKKVDSSFDYCVYCGDNYVGNIYDLEETPIKDKDGYIFLNILLLFTVVITTIVGFSALVVFEDRNNPEISAETEKVLA